MYSVLQQEKTNLRDSRGGTVYRRLYLCDTAADVKVLPQEDAPGSLAVVADGGDLCLLDHSRTWRPAGSGQGGVVWRS